jgi:hypothetical protein
MTPRGTSPHHSIQLISSNGRLQYSNNQISTTVNTDSRNHNNAKQIISSNHYPYTERNN